MKCRVVIDKEREEEVVVYSHGENGLFDDIKAFVEKLSVGFVGYDGTEVKPLAASEIFCFAIDGGKIYAFTENLRFEIKQRLYEIEGRVGKNFVKINQSCIVNAEKIEKFTVSFGASLCVVLKNGYKDYVSRRQLKAVKEKMGVKI